MASGEGGILGGAKILPKIVASPLSVIKIVKYCGVRGGGGALRCAKILQKIMVPPLSVIKIMGKNILLINNIIVYCLSLLPSVLFEKLTATVVFYFTRCHLKTFDNCHVLIIHIQYTIALGLILTMTRFNVFRYIVCCIINLVILFNIFTIFTIFKLHSR